ncbi:hypothetical protein HG442_004345 [Candidatus Gracilibacteria bacterium]|nr:hypothetical protein [Candidatus Gracilibacteria bacterium]
MTKNFSNIYLAVKNEGSGAISALAEELGKSPPTITASLRKGDKMHYNNKQKYITAINKVFQRNYTYDELFPLHK